MPVEDLKSPPEVYAGVYTHSTGLENLIANHRFEGVLHGFSLGGAVRWRSADTIGYRGMANPLVPTSGLLVQDVSKPIRGPEDFATDGWLNYAREIKLGGRKYTWTAQLNVRNVFNHGGIVPVSAYATGVYSGYTRLEPRAFIFTNTLKF